MPVLSNQVDNPRMPPRNHQLLASHDQSSYSRQPHHFLKAAKSDAKVSTVNSRYSGPLNCGHLDIAATYLGTDFKVHQDCTNLVSDLRSPRYSVLQPLLETPLSATVFILQLEVMFVGVVMIKNMTTTMHNSHQKVKWYTVVN